MLLSAETQRERKFALGDSLGQCCGGSVTLRFTKVEEMSASPEPAFDVVLFGAGHVGKEVARILERLPCRLTWIDPRPEAVSIISGEGRKSGVEEEPAWMVDEAPPGALYLVMTHSHALDLEIVERVLKRKRRRVSRPDRLGDQGREVPPSPAAKRNLAGTAGVSHRPASRPASIPPRWRCRRSRSS